MVKGVYFNLKDTLYDMYEKKYEQKISVKKGINIYTKQREEKYLCLNIKRRCETYEKDLSKDFYFNYLEMRYTRNRH